MKIGVSATAGSMDAEVEARFGRSPYFVIVDSESMESEAYDNQAAGLAHGAGTTTAQELKRRGVELVLTGQVGPKAQSALDAAGMQIVTGANGKVREAVERQLGKT